MGTTGNIKNGEQKDIIFNKFEYDAIRDEFNQLRDEIKIRIQKQQEITSFSISILVGFIVLNQFLSHGDMVPIWNNNLMLFFPVVSIIFSSFSLMVMEHEANIAQIYIYINSKLLKRINEIIITNDKEPQEVWGWNNFRAEIQHRAGFKTVFNSVMSWSKYAITIVPNLIILYLLINLFKPGVANYIFLLLSLIIFIWMLVTGIYTGYLYYKMAHSK